MQGAALMERRKLGDDNEKVVLYCLVVEDEPAILRLVKIALGDVGCVTFGATDAEAALEMLGSSSFNPDLTITDIRLPGMDGVELTRRIKADPALSDKPVILMSAYGEPRHHEGDAFIAKPFDVDEFAETVASYLPDPDPA